MTQTRVEGALGQYGIAVDYLKRLSELPDFTDTVDPLHLRSAVLLSLINEIGQYAYSSQVYSATGSKVHDPRVRGAVIVSEEPLSSMISKYWDLDPDTIAALLTAVHPKANPKPWRLILSILYGPMSAQNVDLVMRTSLRAGLSTGFDYQRFIRSLRISSEGDSLTVDSEHLSLLESLLLAQYMLLEHVLFHHTVLAADRMLAHAFRELNNSGFDFEPLLTSYDQEFLDSCMQQAHERGLARAENLLRSYSYRKLHKRVAMWGDNENERIPVISDGLALSTELEAEFSKRFGYPFPPGSIIVDSQMHVEFPFTISVASSNGDVQAEEASPLIANILQKIRQDIFGRQRLFASEEVADNLRTIGYKQVVETT